MDLKEIFEFFDKNSDGVISRSEMVDLVEVVLGEKGKGKSSAIMGQFDANGNGVIDYDEYLNLMKEHGFSVD